MTIIDGVFNYVVAPVVTFLVGWFSLKIKQKIASRKAEALARISELENVRTERVVELDNVQKAIKIWSDLAERLENKLSQRDEEIQGLKAQLTTISTQYESLIKKLTQIEKDYSLLEKNYKELKKELSK